MKIERTKNATRNIIFLTIQRIYQIVVPFLMRTAMIYFMGVKYLGLSSLFSSILQVLNMAELGVGSAMVYSMYKPIAEDDTKKICALMRMYKIYYRIIGAVIGGTGIILMPFVPNLINGDIPAELNIYVLYLLNLGATVISYWLFAYKNCLVNAHQRNDISSKISFVTTSVQYGLQLSVIIYLKDYYVYLIVALATQAFTNVVISIVVTKMFPDYKAAGKLGKKIRKEINGRIRDLFTSKIGAVIVNSADTIVISSFLGLTVLAVYQNYYYILNSLVTFVGIIFTACTAGIGNSLVVESKEKNFQDFNKFTFIIAWMAGFGTVCLLCLYEPFMDIWVGKDLELNFLAVVCFCVYYFIYEINQLLNMYKDAGGIWHEDRFRPLVTAGLNLTLNLIMVQFWEIYGVLLSTVISMLFVGMPWILHNLFTTIFEKKFLRGYLIRLFTYVFVTVVAALVTYLFCNCFSAGLVGTLIIRSIICCIVPNIIFLIAYIKRKEFREAVLLLNRITKGKISFLNNFSMEN